MRKLFGLSAAAVALTLPLIARSQVEGGGYRFQYSSGGFVVHSRA